MKKQLVYLLLIVSTCSFGQGYVSIGATNKGIQVGAGVLANNVDLFVRYQHPIVSLEIPRILSLNVGRRILLSHNEFDNFSVTPSVGYAYLKSNDFSLYYAQDKILLIEKFSPVFNIEVGKDWYMGRLYLNYMNCNGSYFGIGIKCFFSPPKINE